MVLLDILWRKNGQRGNAWYATVPVPESGKSMSEIHRDYDLLLARPKIRDVFQRMNSCDWLFAGIGTMTPPPEYLRQTTSMIGALLGDFGVTEAALVEQGAVGDISYAFFDLDGVSRTAWRCFLGLSVDKIHEMATSPGSRVVLLAGRYKAAPLLAALRRPLVSDLIVVESVAREVLRLAVGQASRPVGAAPIVRR
jgi:DNA-binding transcriptional regulator LsrR (DeoR family)